MTRLFGQSPTPRSSWLLLVLAITLLVGISTTTKARTDRPAADTPTAAAVSEVDRKLGALRAFAERIDRPAAVIPAALAVHPALGDGGPGFLRAATDRLITTVGRSVARLAAGAGPDQPAALVLAQLMNELHELRRQLAALDVTADAEAAARRRIEAESILTGMHEAWSTIDLDTGVDAATAHTEPPIVLRGRDL